MADALAISKMEAAGSLDGNELVEVAVLSSTITITASTISAAAADNSFNDSGNGFLSAGFLVGMNVKPSGFTGNVANNIVSATITALTASKMTIGGADGSVIVDDAAGESVTITAWETKRTTAAALAGAGSDVAAQIHSATSKATPVDDDELGIADSAAAWVLKKLTWANLKATLTSFINGLIATYVAAQDVEVFKGPIDCSANPNYPAADAGHVYRVSVAGKIGGGSGPNVEVGDRLECFVDGSSSGNHATVGANWMISQVNIDGAVVGPSSATADRIATFNGTTGKIIQDGGKTISDLRTPAVQTVASAATVTPTFSNDIVKITAQAAPLALANPTGTAIPELGIVIRIKDNGTARAISYDTQYRAIGVTLPTTTVVSKTLYLGCVWNSDDTRLDVVAVAQEA